MKNISGILLFLTLILISCSNNSRTETGKEPAGYATAEDTTINYEGRDQRSLYLKSYNLSLQHFKSKEFKEAIFNLVESMGSKITEWTNSKLTKGQMMEKASMELENLFINYDKSTARSLGFYDYTRYAEVGKNLMGDPEFNALIEKIMPVKEELKYYFETLMNEKLSVVPAN